VGGVWNDHLLKSDKNISMHTINISLYAFGFLMNGASYLYLFDQNKKRDFFSGFDKVTTYLVLLCQTLFGITVSAVYKFSDATVKTFALSCATSVLMFIDVSIFGAPFSLVATMGCLTVFAATHLYVTNPSTLAAGADKIITATTTDTDHTHKTTAGRVQVRQAELEDRL
jgi:hypothetical protein